MATAIKSRHRNFSRFDASQRAWGVRIVKPLGEFRPRGPNDKPRRSKLVRATVSDVSLDYAKHAAASYNKQALAHDWSTWAVVSQCHDMAAAVRTAERAAELVADNDYLPSLSVDVRRIGGEPITGRFELSGDCEMTGGPRAMALAAIQAARAKLDDLETRLNSDAA